MDGHPRQMTLRPPGEVMRLARMGSAHASRLSFMRILLRRAQAEKWQIDCPIWEIDARGVGHAVYRVRTPVRTYSLVAFAHDLPDELRSDRVIAEAWDATFALFDGEPQPEDIVRLADNVPRQEAGRVSGTELTLSRANRSVRLFGDIVERLAAGEQPDVSEIDKVGYLMRTTAVYGSAKFGLSDRDAIADRGEMAAPFQAEMLTVWLIRSFTVDIVEHMARVRSPGAARLDRSLRRRLGVGNSTGLGMAPFLLNHPVLIHHWFAAREEALARVRALAITAAAMAHFRRALDGAARTAAAWTSEHALQVVKLDALRSDIARISVYLDSDGARLQGWDALWRWGEQELSLEGQELLVALLLEPHGDLVDGLAETMAADEQTAFPIDGRQRVGTLRDLLTRDYAWALETDWSQPAAKARLWYTSAEKLEPRLAERAEEPLEPYEQPLGPGRDVAALAVVLADWPADTRIAEVLLSAPEHRHTVRRVQIAARHPYAEVRDNTLDAGMMPIDLLRAKLSFFGATRFDPRSDRWLRISMFQGAPFPDELGTCDMDVWMYGA